MKIRLLGVLGWLLFCVVFLLCIKLLLAGSLERFFFHWDAVLWMFIKCLMGAALIVSVKRGFGLLRENSTSTSRDFLVLIAAIPLITLVTTVWGLVVIEELYYGKSHTLYDWVMEYLIDFITQTMVGFSCISYFYVSDLVKTKERLLASQNAQSEMKLRLLQQQVDPHFLFNNLNVLSSLIDKQPAVANEFLSKLADLYRYVLRTGDLEVIAVKDEIEFAKNYLYLIQGRFGDAFDFDWRIPSEGLNGQMVVPAALQTLLENVVKHNAGDSRDPLRVRIEIGDTIKVENELRSKALSRPVSGTGLRNIVERYSYLTERPVEIKQSDELFSVKLPLIELKK